MIKLRTILLCNFPYYIILLIALLYFLITNFFIVYKSNYDEISSINAKIIDIDTENKKIGLSIKELEGTSYDPEYAEEIAKSNK